MKNKAAAAPGGRAKNAELAEEQSGMRTNSSPGQVKKPANLFGAQPEVELV